MAAAAGSRGGLTATELRQLTQSRRDAGQVRRLLLLAVIYDGGSRSEAARIGGVGLQTMRDWVLRFNRDGPDGLVDGKAPGGRRRLDANQRAALAAGRSCAGDPRRVRGVNQDQDAKPRVARDEFPQADSTPARRTWMPYRRLKKLFTPGRDLPAGRRPFNLGRMSLAA